MSHPQTGNNTSEEISKVLFEQTKPVNKLILIRVPYGRKDTKPEDREYRCLGFSPVGTIKEWKEQYPNYEIEFRGDEK